MSNIDLYLRMKRIICPECQGEKTCLLMIDNTNQRAEQICPVCLGEGIVFERREIISLKDALEARK